MIRDVFAGEDAAVAVPYDDWISESLVRQVFCRQVVIFNSFGDGLLGTADALTAIVGAYGIMAASIERYEDVTERGDGQREKARGADVKIHLVAVAIHRGALARSIRSVVGSVQRMRWRGNADKFGAHEKLLGKIDLSKLSLPPEYKDLRRVLVVRCLRSLFKK